MAGGDAAFGEMQPRTFPASARLHRPKEFATVLASPLRSRSGPFEVRFRLNAAGQLARLGLVVPKRLAPRAVLRNSIKRVAREAFRHCRAGLPPADIVIRLAGPVACLPGREGSLRKGLWREQIENLLASVASRRPFGNML